MMQHMSKVIASVVVVVFFNSNTFLDIYAWRKAPMLLNERFPLGHELFIEKRKMSRPVLSRDIRTLVTPARMVTSR